MRIALGDQGGTWVPDRYAGLGAWLWELAVHHLERNEGWRVPEEFVAMVEELHQAGEARAARAAGCGKATKQVSEPSGPAIVGEKLLTTREAAARANVSEQAIRRATNEGRLPGRRHGKVRVFEERDIDAYIPRRNAA